jgi:hypothetical protein
VTRFGHTGGTNVSLGQFIARAVHSTPLPLDPHGCQARLGRSHRRENGYDGFNQAGCERETTLQLKTAGRVGF